MRRSRPSNPYWLTARFISVCSRCAAKITKGERIFYYPNTRSALCMKDTCGMQAARDTAANDYDEANNLCL